MYRQFTFKQGNPYVTMTDEEFFRMICKYEVEQVGKTTFEVLNERKPARTYAEKKAILREFAIDWQLNFVGWDYGWGNIYEYEDFFRLYGGRYGLLREFRENAIC